MKYDAEPILKNAEAELAELLKDQQQLSDLHGKYVAEYDAAEKAWKQDRKPAQLDKMQQAKAYRDTVTQSLQEQAHEVAKARSHVAQLREQLRRQGVLSALAEDITQLSALQAQHSEGVLDLQAYVRHEVLRLLGLRDEWRQKHVQAWERVASLSTDRTEAFTLMEGEKLDLKALQLAAPTVGASLAPYQKAYSFPQHPDADVQKSAGWIVQAIMQPEFDRFEAATSAHRLGRRSVVPYQEDEDEVLLPRLAVRKAQGVPAEEDEDNMGRIVVQAGQTITRENLGGDKW